MKLATDHYQTEISARGALVMAKGSESPPHTRRAEDAGLVIQHHLHAAALALAQPLLYESAGSTSECSRL